MVIAVSRRGRTVGGLCFTERERREDDDSGFI